MTKDDPDLDCLDFGYAHDLHAIRWRLWWQAFSQEPATVGAAAFWWISGKRERARNLVGATIGERLRPKRSRTTPVIAVAAMPSTAVIALRRDIPMSAFNAQAFKADADVLCLHWPEGDLPAESLGAVAAAFAANPELAVLYFDESAATPVYSGPLPKPDFDADMVLAADYIGPALAVRRHLLPDLGGLPADRPGTEFRHLVLAAGAQHGAKAIGRCDAAVRRSVAGAPKDGWRAARLRCAADYLARRRELAECTLEEATGIVRVWRALPDPAPRVSVIVPTRDRLDLLRPCLEGVLSRTDYPAIEVIVVDNGSMERETLAYLDVLSGQGRISILRMPGPFNFSALNNAAARLATGAILVFLNNDVEVRDGGWLKEMAADAIRPGIGAVGAKLFYPDGRIQHGGIVLGGPAMARHAYRFFPGDHAGYLHRLRVPHRADAVTAACLAVSAEKFHAVDGFDEAEFPVAYNDVDLCLKLEAAGLATLWTPYATLVHKEQATRGAERDKREAQAFARKWRDRLAACPVNPIDA